MTRQTIRYIILTLLTLSSGVLYITANTIFPIEAMEKKAPKLDIQQEQKATLHYLNQLREGAGLTPLRSNKALTLAAKNHANYLIKNKKIGHYEHQKDPLFTGEYGSSRAIYTGYNTPMIIENVSSNNQSYKESIDGLMAAIYHRFGFLDFHINEIGIGIDQSKQNLYQTAFVYDMGNQEINNLCRDHPKVTNTLSAVNVCANKEISIPKRDFFRAINSNKENSHTVSYPYANQIDVPPVFYEEFPDPLPKQSVSGFPISLSFDEFYFKTIKMISFKLYNSKGEEIQETLMYDQKSDPNHRLKKFEFALFPLQRLAWSSTYSVEAIYQADGIPKTRRWHFTTKTFKEPLYAVTPNNHHYRLAKGASAIFYFPPYSTDDTLPSLRYPSSLDIQFVDKNTIKITAKETFQNRVTLKIGQHQLSLDILNP